MHERLVEDWLDNASERSYQAPFCQMLIADGHKIVHSTRHSPIELGKDVISIDSDGTVCCYQLKGNPGGRLTHNGFRNIQSQLRELVELAVSHPDVPRGQHRSFLVTNGQIEEEARLAIERMNRGWEDAGYSNRRLEVIQRGDLLHMAKRLGFSLWPTEVGQIHLLLEMLVEDGRGRFPANRLSEMLEPLLGLGESREDWSAAELRRRVTSAAVLTALSLRSYVRAGNHFAVASAWSQFATAAIAACSRYRRSFARNAQASVELALMATKDALVDLAKDASDRDSLIEGDARADTVFYAARCTLLAGVMSLLWIWCEEQGWPDDLDRASVEALIEKCREHLTLWGEGAIPQLLPIYWYLRRVEAGSHVDWFLESLLSALVASDDDGQPAGLPSPYWTYSDVARHQLAPILGHEQDPLRNESVRGMTFTAEGLLHLLVRTKRKQACKQVWPDFSRFLHVQFKPEYEWEYCIPKSRRGTYVQIQPQLRKEWSELTVEARAIACEGVPDPLVSRPFLHALWSIVCPHRATPDTLRRLGHEMCPVWMLDPPIT